MNDNKAFVYIMSGLFLFGMVGMSVSSFTSAEKEVAKEKTKQLELQFKIDSLNAIQKK